MIFKHKDYILGVDRYTRKGKITTNKNGKETIIKNISLSWKSADLLTRMNDGDKIGDDCGTDVNFLISILSPVFIIHHSDGHGYWI